MGTGLDPRQREAVDCDLNSVVTAGAGSGKTTVLAERYLRLVKEGEAGVDRILTLTFTRKAAAEMYDRIYRLLVRESGHPNVDRELARFDRARISTLDSFCSQILRGCSQRFGIPPHFSLDEEEVRKLSDDMALGFLFDRQDEPVLLEFIAANGFEAVWKRFFAALARDYFTLAGEKDLPGMCRDQLRKLQEMISESAKRIDAGVTEISALDPSAGKLAAEAVALAAGLPPLSGLVAEERLDEAVEAAGKLSRLRLPGSQVKHPDLQALREVLSGIRSESEPLREAAGTLRMRDSLEGIFDLTMRFQSRVLRERRVRGLLSFQDVVDLAVRALTEDHELRRQYKERYRYLMIDEFQDNNMLQKQLLYLLAERLDREGEGVPGPDDLVGDKLFFVGDEKQSIYRFRGADVSVFKALSGELSSRGGRSISLDTNYRSEPDLISFFNALFPRVMAGAGLPFEAEFSPLSARPQASAASPCGDPSPEPAVTIRYKPDVSGDGMLHADDAEAWYVAKLIRESVEHGRMTVRDGEGMRPADYGDFAILMRSTSNQIRYERMLRRFGVPYSTQSVRSLFLEAPLNDIYALLRLAVVPEDRFAYAVLLRSPLVGLSDDGVSRLLLSRRSPFSPAGKSELSDRDDVSRYAAGTELFAFFRERVDSVPIARLLHHAWYDFGYRFLLLRNPAWHSYLEYYAYFRELAIEADRRNQTLARFLDFLRPNLGKYERIPELEIVRDGASGVQLMTIHKSKGLQFPVVILANTGNAGRGDTAGSGLYAVSEQWGLTLNMKDPLPGGGRLNALYRAGKEEERRKEDAELKRLLYVALTRAESRLVITGCRSDRNRNRDGVLLNMILSSLEIGDLTGPVTVGGVPVEIGHIPDVPEDEPFHSAPGVTGSRDPFPLAERYAAARVVQRPRRIRELDAADLVFPPGETDGEGITLPALGIEPLIRKGRLEGVFGQLCLQLLRDPGFPQPGADRIPLVVPPYILGRIPAGVRGEFLREARAVSERFLSTPAGILIRGAGGVPAAAPFLYRLHHEGREWFLRGEPSLLLESGGEIRVLEVVPDRLLIPGRYDLKLGIYRLAFAGRISRPVRCALVSLRDGVLRERTGLPGAAELARVLESLDLRQLPDTAGTGEGIECREDEDRPSVPPGENIVSG